MGRGSVLEPVMLAVAECSGAILGDDFVGCYKGLAKEDSRDNQLLSFCLYRR